MKRGARVFLGIVLTVSMLLAGLIIGMWVGGTFLVAKSAGLAGAAEVIWYGLFGAIAAGIIGFVLSRKLGGKSLVWTTVLLGPVGLAVAVLMIRGYSASQKETQAHLEEAYNNLPAFHAVLEQNGGPAFDRIEINWAARRYTAMIDGRTCSAQLSGPEAVALLGSLRNADLVLFKNPAPCNDAETTHTLTYQIEETKRPVTQGSVSFGQGPGAAPGAGKPLRGRTPHIAGWRLREDMPVIRPYPSVSGPSAGEQNGYAISGYTGGPCLFALATQGRDQSNRMMP